jgi:hypothetical protein
MPIRASLTTSLLLIALLLSAVGAHAQDIDKRPPDRIQTERAVSTFAGIGLGAFLPMRESFRLNYSTDLAGVPLEVLGFVQFPITERTITHVQIRFTRREANFIENSEIRMVQLEPSMRYYLQPPSIDKTEEGDRKTEFGLFAGFGGQISRTTVYGIVQETPDGNDPHPREVTKDHYNLGIGVDLGLTYPFSLASFVDAGIHVSTYLNDPVKLGGLGNLGGVSFNVAYRFGF